MTSTVAAVAVAMPRFLNRERAILEFNRRVLAQAQRDDVPLLEIRLVAKLDIVVSKSSADEERLAVPADEACPARFARGELPSSNHHTDSFVSPPAPTDAKEAHCRSEWRRASRIQRRLNRKPAALLAHRDFRLPHSGSETANAHQ